MKMRDYMDRRVTLPKRVTSPTWGPPPPCKQALKHRRFSGTTGSRLFAFLGSGFAQNFGSVVALRVTTLSSSNLVASRHLKREKKPHFRLTSVAQNVFHKVIECPFSVIAYFPSDSSFFKLIFQFCFVSNNI